MNKLNPRVSLNTILAKTGMLLMVCFSFAICIQTANAQASFETPTSIKVSTQNGINPDVLPQILDHATLVSVGHEAKLLMSTTGGTQVQQAEREIQAQYYFDFSKSVVAGLSPSAAFSSLNDAELNKLIAQFPGATSITPISVRQSLLQLLQQQVAVLSNYNQT